MLSITPRSLAVAGMIMLCSCQSCEEKVVSPDAPSAGDAGVSDDVGMDAGVVEQDAAGDAGAGDVGTSLDSASGDRLTTDTVTRDVVFVDMGAEDGSLEDAAANLPPSAEAGDDRTVEINTEVTLDGCASSDPEQDTLSYRWSQVTGTTVHFTDISVCDFSFTAPGYPEQLVFELEVSDGLSTATDRVIIDVFPPPPVAHAGASFEVNGLDTVTLDGSASADSLGLDLAYSWEQIAGPEVELRNATTVAPRFSAPLLDSSLEFELTVNNGYLDSSSESVVVSVLGHSGARARFIGEHPFQYRVELGDAPEAAAVHAGYLYIAAGTLGLQVYDLSDPYRPSYVTSYAMRNATDVVIQDSMAYVTNNGVSTDPSMYILDLSTPSNPTLAGTYSGSTYGAWEVVVRGTLAYLAHGWDGFVIVDVSNPMMTSKVGSNKYSGYDYDVALYGDWAFVGNDEKLLVYDIEPPNFLSSPAVTYNLPRRDLKVVGDHLLLTGATGTRIMNVTDPENMTEVWARTDKGFNIEVSGTQMRLGLGYGLDVYDISTITSPTLLESYSDYEVWLPCGGGSLIYGMSFTGLQVIDPSIPFAPRELTRGSTGSSWGTRANGEIFQRGGVLLTSSSGSNRGSLTSYDVSASGLPVHLDSYVASRGLRDVELVDDRALLAVPDLGLQILSLTDPENLSLLGSYDDPNANFYPVAVTASDTFAVVAHEYYRANLSMSVLDVSRPEAPVLLYDMDFADPIQSLARDGDRVFACGSSHTYVIDLSAPASPQVLGETDGLPALGSRFDSLYWRQHLYSQNEGGVRILDVSSSASPSVVHWIGFDTPVSVNGIHRDFRQLYVAQGQTNESFELKHSALWIYDVGVAAEPVLTGASARHDLAGAAVVDDRLFLIDHERGLVTLPAPHVEVTLFPLQVSASASTVLDYTVTWIDLYPASDERLACTVTGGSCAITAQDQAAHSASVQWTLPATAGDHELLFAVGNQRHFVSASDRVRVQ